MRTDATLQGSNNEEGQPELGRRGFLKLAAGGLGALTLAPTLLEAAIRRDRYLLFYNPNTGGEYSPSLLDSPGRLYPRGHWRGKLGIARPS